MAGKLLLLKRESYGQRGIDSAVAVVFEHFGGIRNFVKPGDSVLLKVNLVMGHKPERCVTTHPSVVRAVARAVIDAGGHPVIADSPGIDSFGSAARTAGFAEAARELGISCIELTDPVPMPVAPGASFRKIEVARKVLESDVIINLPKMKTHGQMLLTLGVKNMFGCVVAQRKAEWHYNVGLNRGLFASLLLDIWNGTRPALTILDGVIGMDGTGPTNGEPYPYGVIGGARDALVMDFWLCRMLGVNFEDFPLWKAASARNMPQCGLDESDLAGDFQAGHRWEGVNIPKLYSMSVTPFLSPLPFGKTLEQSLASRPAHRTALCIGCGKCAAMCQAGAITQDGKKIAFDYKKCIRCYCCHEMCPVNAIEFKDGLMRKLMKLLGK
ncbi:MAG: DUF362 domain-containing protein [Synergistaceae bacterium]|jgi:uncharacterized protein (DUF362 family)/Pyruvate/2-oxoacid:ferredoxin oxidoreductase delta subunit|nr:DUF362 domain-containing protein [Synergistaceae bacterium]